MISEWGVDGGTICAIVTLIEETECFCSGTRVHVANMSLVSCVMVFQESCREILYLSHVCRVVTL